MKITEKSDISIKLTKIDQKGHLLHNNESKEASIQSTRVEVTSKLFNPSQRGHFHALIRDHSF
jgi:hypothetical protein